MRNPFKPWPSRLAAAAIVAVLSACGDGTDPVAFTEEVPGTLTVHWVTPNEAEGAVRLTLRGPEIDSIRSAQPDRLVFTRSDGTVHNIAIIGSTATGALLRFEVPDIRRADLYQVTLVEVADLEKSELRARLDDYTVTVE